MNKTKNVIIEIENDDFNSIAGVFLKKTIDYFLIDNQNICLSSIIKGNCLYDVLLEVLNGDKTNVVNCQQLYSIFEQLYDYWRASKRFILSDLSVCPFINEDNFLTYFDLLNEKFLKAYRTICFELTNKGFSVYRQLAAFSEIFLLLNKNDFCTYKELCSARLISKVAFRTPLISYSCSNKRSGVFPIINKNPINNLNLSNDRWFVMPILSGQTKILVYFPSRFMSLGVSLSNLFQLNEDYKSNKPDAIVIFGSNTINGIYYDSLNDIYIGSLVESNEIDYFGYLKKLILTIHNIKMINHNKLPIHGAGVSIVFKNGNKKNIVIVGDSGAGKSETIEALKNISGDEITKITTIYDDMGTLEIADDKVLTFGTEIGAFVRIDDLENDYVYKVFDRAIFLNPNQKNARLIIPVTPYEDVIKRYFVDFILYANNYEDAKEKLVLIDSLKDAVSIFVEGKRIALGTTNESGISSTFFANPFGPAQMKEETKQLIDTYFKKMMNDNVKIGQLYTGLGLPNGKTNAKQAAEALLKALKQ